MNNRTEMSRRRILGGVLAVGTASAAAGAGTMAAFSDTESSDGNAVSAGTLDLTIDGGDQTVAFLDETDVSPGDSGSGSVALANAGSVPGTLEITVADVRSTENGFYGDEESQDGSPDDGELDEHLEVRALLGGTEIVGWTTADVVSEGQTFTATSVSGGGSVSFEVEWRLPSDASNLVQSDGFSFDLTFRLIQEGST